VKSLLTASAYDHQLWLVHLLALEARIECVDRRSAGGVSDREMAWSAVDPVGGYSPEILSLKNEDSVRAHLDDPKDLWSGFHLEARDDLG
jgi:hypothetical protein